VVVQRHVSSQSPRYTSLHRNGLGPNHQIIRKYHLPVRLVLQPGPGNALREEKPLICSGKAFLIEHPSSGKRIVFDLGVRKEPNGTRAPFLCGILDKFRVVFRPDTAETLLDGGVDLNSISSIIWRSVLLFSFSVLSLILYDLAATLIGIIAVCLDLPIIAKRPYADLSQAIQTSFQMLPSSWVQEHKKLSGPDGLTARMHVLSRVTSSTCLDHSTGIHQLTRPKRTRHTRD
jgi:hypothetical protein